MGHDDRHNIYNNPKIRNPSLGKISITILIDKKESRSHTQLELKSAVETSKGQEMRSLVDKTICNVFSTGEGAANYGIRILFFFIVENIMVEKMQSRVLYKTLDQ